MYITAIYQNYCPETCSLQEDQRDRLMAGLRPYPPEELRENVPGM